MIALLPTATELTSASEDSLGTTLSTALGCKYKNATYSQLANLPVAGMLRIAAS